MVENTVRRLSRGCESLTFHRPVGGLSSDLGTVLVLELELVLELGVVVSGMSLASCQHRCVLVPGLCITRTATTTRSHVVDNRVEVTRYTHVAIEDEVRSWRRDQIRAPSLSARTLHEEILIELCEVNSVLLARDYTCRPGTTYIERGSHVSVASG